MMPPKICITGEYSGGRETGRKFGTKGIQRFLPRLYTLTLAGTNCKANHADGKQSFRIPHCQAVAESAVQPLFTLAAVAANTAEPTHTFFPACTSWYLRSSGCVCKLLVQVRTVTEVAVRYKRNSGASCASHRVTEVAVRHERNLEASCAQSSKSLDGIRGRRITEIDLSERLQFPQPAKCSNLRRFCQ